jgi:archaellum component FlaC
MEDLDDSISELNARIGSISEDVFDMRESFEHIEKMFKEFKDKLPNDE